MTPQWYREEGLEVKILRGAGGGDTIKRIAVGQGKVPGQDLYTNDLLPERK